MSNKTDIIEQFCRNNDIDPYRPIPREDGEGDTNAFHIIDGHLLAALDEIDEAMENIE